MVQLDMSIASTRSQQQQFEKNCFRQVCDKPCAHRIIEAEWSPMHDLIAVITSNGEVRLHRMYWQKVWMLPSKDTRATSLAWKFNGRLLAIGYENGDVNLLEIEKSVVVHSTSSNAAITSLTWVAKQKEKHGVMYEDCSEKWLPEINREEFKKELQYTSLNIGDEGQYSILMVGNAAGEVFLYIEGVYLILRISVGMELRLSPCSVLNSHLAMNSGVVSIICKGDMEMGMEGESSASYFLHQVRSDLLSRRGAELSHVAMKFTKMKNTLNLCGNILKQMSDASEDVCVKINSKLEKLEQLLPSGCSVSSEFTVAYATGRISQELATFLRDYLTGKGLKQIAAGIQSAYISLRCDVGELDTITQQLLSHILELRGMVSWEEKFAVLGLSMTEVEQCITLISQFRMKTQQLLDVISSDMLNFTVFFSWLKNILFQATGDVAHVAPFQLSNEEYDVMMDFLEYRLLKVEKANGESAYDLERVSQYFCDGSLVDYSAACDGGESVNVWNAFVEKTPMLKECPLIMKPAHKDTLHTLHKKVKKNFATVFDSVANHMSESLSTTLSTNLYNAPNTTQQGDHEEETVSHFSFMGTARDSLLILNLPCTYTSDRMFLLEVTNEQQINIVGLYARFSSELLDQSRDEEAQLQCRCTLRDVKFYNEELITLVAEEEEKSTDHLVTLLAQFPYEKLLTGPKTTVAPAAVKGILEDRLAGVDWICVNDYFSELRRMEAFRGKLLYVNGTSRKVSSIVSMSGRRIRIFDMTALDDELEESKMDESRGNESKLSTGFGEAIEVDGEKLDESMNIQ